MCTDGCPLELEQATSYKEEEKIILRRPPLVKMLTLCDDPQVELALTDTIQTVSKAIEKAKEIADVDLLQTLRAKERLLFIREIEQLKLQTSNRTFGSFSVDEQSNFTSAPYDM